MAVARGQRVTQSQMRTLIDFLTDHRPMLIGKVGENFSIKDRRELWEELATILNADGRGPQKNAEKWRKTWNDFKTNVKHKVLAAKKDTQKVDGDELRIEDRLTPLENRVRKLLGKEIVIRQSEQSSKTTTTQSSHIDGVSVNQNTSVSQREELEIPEEKTSMNHRHNRLESFINLEPIEESISSHSSSEAIGKREITEVNLALEAARELQECEKRKAVALETIATSFSNMAASMANISTSFVNISVFVAQYLDYLKNH